MAKPKIQFFCTECGNETPRWAGQCPACKAWNTLTESKVVTGSSGKPLAAKSWTGSRSEVQCVADIAVEDVTRISSGSNEFDRVLGGGLVNGSVVLIGGDPGIGKSTLLTQSLALLSERKSVLYVTGEESPRQVAMHVKRLHVPAKTLKVLAETSIEAIVKAAEREKPSVVVVDSIQTVFSSDLPSAPGSVAQVRECAAMLVRMAKASGVTVLVVGHVTKEGSIAGPRVLEHMVDTVLYFEGDNASRYRLLRAMKNRFGAINEIGVFAMTDTGLRDVPNPSAMFTAREGDLTSGSVIMATQEGTRPLLVEIQALVDSTSLANPRRLSVGLDQNRLAMLLAVLHRHADIFLQDQDIFVNVAGGVRISETASDLGVVAALISSFRDRPLQKDLVVFGEVGLGGEIRPVQRGEERIIEAGKLGFGKIIVPWGNRPKKTINGIEVIAVKNISGFLESLQECAQP